MTIWKDYDSGNKLMRIMITFDSKIFRKIGFVTLFRRRGYHGQIY